MRQWQKENSKTLDVYLADKKEEERKEKRRNYLLAGLGAVLLTILAFRLIQTRKERSDLRS